MKKKLAVMACMCLVVASMAACGKQNTDSKQNTDNEGIIITAGDANVDTAKDDKVLPDNNAERLAVEDKNEKKTVDTEVEQEHKVEYTKYGAYINDVGDTYIFNEDNTFEKMDGATYDTVAGTYDTDWKTYITMEYDEVTASAQTEQSDAQKAYDKLLEDKTSYAYLRSIAYSYNICDEALIDASKDDEESEEPEESEEEPEEHEEHEEPEEEPVNIVLVAYDEEGNEIGRASYDAETDIYNIPDEEAEEAEEEKTEHISVTYEMTFEDYSDTTGYHVYTMTLVKGKNTIVLTK